jgi:hypothetical protein
MRTCICRLFINNVYVNIHKTGGRGGGGRGDSARGKEVLANQITVRRHACPGMPQAQQSTPSLEHVHTHTYILHLTQCIV